MTAAMLSQVWTLRTADGLGHSQAASQAGDRDPVGPCSVCFRRRGPEEQRTVLASSGGNMLGKVSPVCQGHRGRPVRVPGLPRGSHGESNSPGQVNTPPHTSSWRPVQRPYAVCSHVPLPLLPVRPPARRLAPRLVPASRRTQDLRCGRGKQSKDHRRHHRAHLHAGKAYIGLMRCAGYLRRRAQGAFLAEVPRPRLDSANRTFS